VTLRDWGQREHSISATRRFQSTKLSELRFRALLTEGGANVLFYRVSFDWSGEDLA
jgi:hypothetical protein